MRKPKKIIHVNQSIIRRNVKNGDNEPCITCKTYKSNQYCHDVSILDRDGREVARLKTRMDNPLSCGARIWLEAYEDVVCTTQE